MTNVSGEVWDAIRSLPGRKRPSLPPKGGYTELYLFKTPVDDTAWLVGHYSELTRFATSLRSEQALQDFVSENRIRIGLRETDVPPVGDRKEGYGDFEQGLNPGANFIPSRLSPLARPFRDFTKSQLKPVASRPSSASVNRMTDCAENKRKFWASQTPQSHHIVEFNNLKTLGASSKGRTDEMDYLQLPAVLLAAEFHQRYISAILKQAQRWGEKDLRSRVHSVYEDLYLNNMGSKGALFKPLWEISRVILKKAGIEPPKPRRP